MPIYQRGEQRDNCGFGLIAHLDGEPSHRLVRIAIGALDRMDHRGAIGADGKTGDGCGLLLQKPDAFFQSVAREQGFRLANRYAVGVIFLGHGPERLAAVQHVFAEELERETLTLAGWRDVPRDPGVLGAIARNSMPAMIQVFVNGPYGWGPRDFERRLYMVRRRIEKRLIDDPDFYICSLSNLVVVYKGLCRPGDLPRFYPDLGDLRLQAASCLFHQRFSTNTLPRWQLAQPFRYLAHNGEINTISGNRKWAGNRSYKLRSPLLPRHAGSGSVRRQRGVGFSLAGQYARSLPGRRHGPVSRLPPAHSAGLAESSGDGRGSAGLLRFQLDAHGTVGWTGGYRHERRSVCRLRPGSQRSAAGPLRGDQRSPDYAGLRGRHLGLHGR